MDVVLLLDGRLNVERLLEYSQQVDTTSALQALGGGICANHLWDEMEGVVLVARAQPVSMLAAFGNFTPTQRSLLRGLALQINEVASKHHFIDYSTAEIAAERLAKELVRRFGVEELSRFQYTAIPRGGLIVLGMLSYLLDLSPEQIVIPEKATSAVNDEVLVVVDDCALSGVRFQQFLKKVDSAQVIFCPLFAAPELCRAIERAEPRVQACINAKDLQDIAPSRYGEAYAQWLTAHREIRGGHGYWDGITEPLTFSWCEPETRYWNHENKRFEAGWNVRPPGLCLKRRAVTANVECERREAGSHNAVILQTDGPGPLMVAERVLWTEMDSAIAVARMPESALQSSPCFRLEGTAAEMWRCVLEQGTLESAESALLEFYEVDPATLRKDLAAFVSDLVDNGILTRR
ncbi:hypothetical protein GCM10007160_04700 [Litchfieldella qijiaojingensis]|uniref:PqqD family peptide modification chaperone n=1 Tax=Litchfieldella qijiaojingensis TaxID=980347 RepID=A0ABQ2YFA4_9GAMM|nr:PqqD family protein [Halomonas qijiaojingensis]GGX80259.1 hypothetical protein GCM10007160_04700 [Halomonas qijiaojingensis]